MGDQREQVWGQERWGEWGGKGQEKGEGARWGWERVGAELRDGSGVLERAIRARAAEPGPVA